jgi:class 3 adenylate cyclase
MRKGLRFQTKLMLTLVAAIAVVTVALIILTETKVSQAYTRQFSRDFSHIISELELSRLQRTGDFMELCGHLAAHPYIVASLRGDASEEQRLAFWRFYGQSLTQLDSTIENRPDSSPRRPAGLADLIGKSGSIGIVTRAGEITGLFHPQAEANSTSNEKRRLAAKQLRYQSGGVTRAKKRLDDLLASEVQQTLYLPFDYQESTHAVEEVVSTPIKDPASGAIIGHFLRATPAETDAQRFLERYQTQFDSDAPLLSGIFLDGHLYSRHLPEELAVSLAAIVGEKITTAEAMNGEEPFHFETSIGDAPFRLYIAPLNGGGSYDPAYQVSAFSLAILGDDLAELRLLGSGIGAFALLFGVILAYLFSRNLAIPIRELTCATEAVKSGDLTTRITIQSRDEIGELAASFNEMTEGLQQRDTYRGILGKVSDETVAQAMISGDLDLELGGELKRVSVLFCDIRGFTAITEHMPPTDAINLVNHHMTAMTALVRKHDGVVDKFVGDEIMAVFGALKSRGNDATNAAACALEMIAVREQLNRESGKPLEIGIGLATGEVVAGCMGSIDRLNYTVLGARVNLASRLCSEAGIMEIVIDDETKKQLDHPPSALRARPELRLKGFSGTIIAWQLLPSPRGTTAGGTPASLITADSTASQ